MAGSLALARTALFRHPSFWGEDGAEALLQQIVDDPRVTNAEHSMYNAIAAHTTPFVASLDELTVNVGHVLVSEHTNNEGDCNLGSPPTTDCFIRVLAEGTNGDASSRSTSQTSGVLERAAAYDALNKLCLGPERVVSPLETPPMQRAAERRATQRLWNSRLEPMPALKGRASSGNSLFEAFSLSVWGTPTYHTLLRQLVVEHLRQYPREYCVFLGKDYERYLLEMARPGVGGDELVLRALADRFGLPITVITGDEFIWCIRYPPKNTVSSREIFLAVAPGACFSAVRRRSTITSIRMSFTRRRRKPLSGEPTVPRRSTA